MVFEDTQSGVEAAIGAHMNVVAVPNDYTRHQSFGSANKIFDSYNDQNKKWVFAWIETAKNKIKQAA